MEVIDENKNTTPVNTVQDNKKVLAGILAIVFGALGVHKFILGYTKEGVIMLLVSILSFDIIIRYFSRYFWNNRIDRRNYLPY